MASGGRVGAWEYRMAFLPSFRPEDLHRGQGTDRTSEVLTGLGAEGWEAVGVTHVVSVPQGCLVLLKRSRGPDGDSSADEGDGLDGRVPPSERGG